MATDLVHVRPRALITGASAGIGAAFARRLAKDGYDLVLVARNGERLRKMADELQPLGCSVEVLPLDLTVQNDIQRLMDWCEQAPALDLLINNAGFGTSGRFYTLPLVHEEGQIQLNILALVRLTRSALPKMVARGRGAVLNVSSIAGLLPSSPYTATYAATKAFVTSFTEAIAEEVRGTGVLVQALCPGFTRTEFQDRAQMNTSRIPQLAWMSAEAVVDISLGSLGKRVICIPGFFNWLSALLISFLPRPLIRRVSALITRTL